MTREVKNNIFRTSHTTHDDNMICLINKQEEAGIYKLPPAAMHVISEIYCSQLRSKHAVHTNINKDVTTLAYNETSFSNAGLL